MTQADPGAAMGTAGVQGDLWGARARDWTEQQESFFRPLYEAALTAAGVGPGSRFLDVGCGAGLALLVARGRGASVSGLDAAASLVEIARTRVADADVRVGEIEALPFPDASFDVVSGFNAFQYAADRVHALAEARRVAGPAGRVVAAVWGAPERCELGGWIAAIGKSLPPPPPGAPGPWALSPPGALEALLGQAGQAAQDASTMNVVMAFPDDATALRGLLSAGVAVRAIRAVGEDAMQRAAREALAPHRRADGTYRLRNEFRYVVARSAV
jgi:SAM-dependent methyltransferase